MVGRESFLMKEKASIRCRYEKPCTGTAILVGALYAWE